MEFFYKKGKIEQRDLESRTGKGRGICQFEELSLIAFVICKCKIRFSRKIEIPNLNS